MGGKLLVGFIEPALAIQPGGSVPGVFGVFAASLLGIAPDASEDRFKLGMLSSRTKRLEGLPLANTARIGWPKLLLELGFE
jgi:hypothetical protein